MCFLARLSDGGDGSSVIFRLTCSSNQSEILQLGCTGASSSIDTALETCLWDNKGSAGLRHPDRMFRNRDFSLFLAFSSRLLLHLHCSVFFYLTVACRRLFLWHLATFLAPAWFDAPNLPWFLHVLAISGGGWLKSPKSSEYVSCFFPMR